MNILEIVSDCNKFIDTNVVFVKYRQKHRIINCTKNKIIKWIIQQTNLLFSSVENIKMKIIIYKKSNNKTSIQIGIASCGLKQIENGAKCLPI